MHWWTLQLIAVALVAAPASAGASTWRIDPVHSAAQFGVRHLMVSTVRGNLGKVTGVVNLDDADVSKSSVEAAIDATGIDTRDPKRDEHLRAADFLDVARYPTITFKSTKVSRLAEDRYQVTGNLTMRGVTKEIVLDVEGIPKPFNDPFGNIKLGGVARTKISRKDFGITWNKALDTGGAVVGDAVDITIDIELTQQVAPAAR